MRLGEPRIPPLPATEWSAEQRALVERYAPEVRIGNAFRTMLRVPELVEAVMPFVLFTSIDSTLPPRHRELLILRTAWLCQSSYLWADHAPTARTAGITPAELRRIAEGPDAAGWDPFEATLLRLADELYVNSSVRDVTWNALAGRYDLYNLFDAVMAVNETTLIAMLYNSWGVQPDDSAQARFPADVPYRLDVPDADPAACRAARRAHRGAGHPGAAHLRTLSRAAGGPRRTVRLRQPHLAADALFPGVADPPHRLELPVGLRMGQARRQCRPRARPRA